MTDREFFMSRWETERPVTLKVVRALPADKLDYRPHARSRSAGELASLLAYEAQTAVEMFDYGKVDWNEPKPPASLQDIVIALQLSNQQVLDRFRKFDDEAWAKKITFFVNGTKAMEESFGDMMWGTFFDTIHHRGQLSAYIRPMGGKVPAIYGPSADEQ